MDIRKTAAHSIPALPVPQRPRTEPNAAPQTGPVQRREPAAQGSDSAAPRRADYPAPVVSGAEPSRGGAESILSPRIQQALKAYQSQENYAQQESRAALTRALGVDYYA